MPKKRPVGTPTESNAKRITTRSNSESSDTSQTTIMSNISAASSTAFQHDTTMKAIGHGKMRTKIIVEVKTVDGEPIKTNITHKEACNLLYLKGLKLDKTNLHGITINWKGNPVLTIRVANPIDIDKLPPKFSYIRRSTNQDGTTNEEMITCEVQGVLDATKPPKPKFPADRWVKIEGSEYGLEEQEVTRWLECYGTPLSKITEDFVEFSDESESEREDEIDSASSIQVKTTICTGCYSIKMRLIRELPQYLPIHGKKIKFHYKGISKQCTNCYDTGHYRANCKNEKITWIDFVEKFIERNTQIPTAWYGRWYTIVDDKKKEAELNKRMQRLQVVNIMNRKATNPTEGTSTETGETTQEATQEATTTPIDPPTKKRGRPNKSKQ